ncbi:MAG TPA: PP2C family serine/threonine-protein phosphatase [Pyrinomonadaceae bacterium]|nr:PP2C family serine/threonine-protein phosphatase [Pyrinomonadaceae bacterium]
MSAPTPADKINVASISDRGLSEKRPMNEDSFLADAGRGIFVVADGVGGADAGEVASQKAVDVLNEAFRETVAAGEDIEDRMELAIQRANSAIHQMAAEHPRFSMMATTVVALHLDGSRATIGHVGDSRLYRVSPEGQLLRETDDHSIVEEEVRAGRMTPEQAANHPSKNVISRALGAEPSVEVDMKTIEVGEGNSFLLCTDGITRHLPDKELRDLMLSGRPVKEICTEMKDRCYQRGAEDNLTAVIVQIGTPPAGAGITLDEERTASTQRYEPAMTAPAAVPVPPETRLTPPSRIAFPGPVNAQQIQVKDRGRGGRSGAGRTVLRFFVFLLFLGVAGGAFYVGMRYQQGRLFPSLIPAPGAATQASPTPAVIDTAAAFEQKRAAVDANPQKWLTQVNLPNVTDSKDPETLYLYGRALMLTGNHRDAMQAFELAVNNLRTENSGRLPFGAEVKLAQAAAALKLKNQPPGGKSQEVLMAEQKAARTLDEVLGLKSEAAPR